MDCDLNNFVGKNLLKFHREKNQKKASIMKILGITLKEDTRNAASNKGEGLCNNSSRLLAISYFCKAHHLRCFQYFWMRLWLKQRSWTITVQKNGTWIYRNLRIWSHLQKKSLMENYIFCAVNVLVTLFLSST